MKKVLFFNYSFFGGGVEKMLIDIAKGLDKSKYDITIMVMSKTGDFTEQYLKLEEEGVHIRQCFDWMQAGSNFFEKILNVVLINVAEKTRFYLPRLYHLIAIRDKYDVEIAFMHNLVNPVIACSPNNSSKKIAWVHTDLSKLTTWKQYFGSRKRQGKFYNKFDNVICVSNHVKNCLLELFPIKPEPMVIYNSVDRDMILQKSLSTDELPKKTVKRVIAVGRLSHEKNFSMLLRVHKKLIDTGIEHELWIVGEGPERKKLETIIKENGLDRVTLWGYQDNPYKFIVASDFLVCSSFYEGLHIASMESLLLGKPIVSCCGVVKEAFGDRQSGLITENNEDALFDGMNEMLTNEKLLKYCTEEAKIRSKSFDLQYMIHEIENVIDV